MPKSKKNTATRAETQPDKKSASAEKPAGKRARAKAVIDKVTKAVKKAVRRKAENTSAARERSSRKSKRAGTALVPKETDLHALPVVSSDENEHHVTGTKFHIGVQHNAHSVPSQSIPYEYGKNLVTLLIVDPRFVFTYWEVRQETLFEATSKMGPHSKLTLRFYDITRSHDPDKSAFWDVEVFDRLGNWYLRLSYPEQILCIDVGLRNDRGEFYRFARSNIMKLPPQSLARPGPIKWMVVTPSGERLISDVEDYTDADLELLRKILGPYFFDLLMRGRFATLSGSSIEAVFYDVEALAREARQALETSSPSSRLPWSSSL